MTKLEEHLETRMSAKKLALIRKIKVKKEEVTRKY